MSRPARLALTLLALVLALVLALGGATAWVLSPPAPLPARFALSDCRRLPLPEPGGPEDLARAPDGALIVSAYDRLAEAAALGETPPRRPPEGVLYRLNAGAPFPRPTVRPLPLDVAIPGGFRPHGVATLGQRLAVINRGYPSGDPPTRRVTIELFGVAPDRVLHRRRIADPALCAANDLAFDGPERLLVTLDRGGCEPSIAETLFSGGGRLIAIDLRTDRLSPVADGFAFANGVLAGPTGWRLAETRGFRIAAPDGATALPGGPDNLTPHPLDGGSNVVAALHPNLVLLALHRAGLRAAAPSRIALLDQTGLEILFDDPDGARLSGATVGALIGAPGAERLIIGSATDPALLVCTPAAAEPTQ